MPATPPISPPPSALVAAHERFQARKDLERQLESAQARVAELERAASRPPSPSPSVPTAVVPVPAAASVSVENLWNRYALSNDALTKYDLACAISAHASGLPIPESVSTEAGRAARLAVLSASIETETDIRKRSGAAIQASALRWGEIPEARYALSEETIDARRAVLTSKLEQTKCPRERWDLATRMP